MNYSEVLQKYLLRVARGELSDTTTILPLLKAAKVFLPQTKNIDLKNLVKITFPLVHKNNLSLIPVYLSRSNSTTYAGTLTNLKNQILDPVEIKGEMLLQVIPNGFGIIVEPSSSLEVIFDHITLKNFLDGAASNHSYKQSKKQKTPPTGTLTNMPVYQSQNNAPAKIIEEVPDDTSKVETEYEYHDDTETFEEVLLESPSIEDTITSEAVNGKSETSINLHVITGGKDNNQDFTPPASEEMLDELSARANSRFNISKLEDELKDVLSSFAGIEEAYLLEHASPHSEIILGLLVKDWVEDERFRIVESVAILSKQTYGYAGAIEVYDDLNDNHSSSWDLFKMIPPFFVKDEESTKLAESIEISQSQDDKKGLRGSMSRLTKTGLKFFSNTQGKEEHH